MYGDDPFAFQGGAVAAVAADYDDEDDGEASAWDVAVSRRPVPSDQADVLCGLNVVNFSPLPDDQRALKVRRGAERGVFD